MRANVIDELLKAISNSGLTEYRVAKDSGVPQPVLNRFLRGERGISLATAAKLCAYLGLHLAPAPADRAIGGLFRRPFAHRAAILAVFRRAQHVFSRSFVRPNAFAFRHRSGMVRRQIIARPDRQLAA